MPMNGTARKVAAVMRSEPWDHGKLVLITLANPGDTLIIDNWRVLHGRSSVGEGDTDRMIERVYLSELQ